MARAFNRLLSHTLQPHNALGSVRLYARWMNRNPAKVMLPFEPESKPSLKTEKIIDLNPDILKKSKRKDLNEKAAPIEDTNEVDISKTQKIKSSLFSSEKSKEIKNKRNEETRKREFYLSQKKVFDDNNEIIFEKLNNKDSRIT